MQCDCTKLCLYTTHAHTPYLSTDSDLRLVQNGISSSSNTRGRLEVYHIGRWGLCVITPGPQQKLVWLVVNLDFLLPAPVGPQVVQEGEEFVLCIYGQCFGQHAVPYHNPERLVVS